MSARFYFNTVIQCYNVTWKGFHHLQLSLQIFFSRLLEDKNKIPVQMNVFVVNHQTKKELSLPLCASWLGCTSLANTFTW